MNDLTVVETPANWDKLKAMVLDSVSSPITKRVYDIAIEEFLAWFRQVPRPGFTKATVSAWRVSLEERRLGSSSIIVRMSAIRKLAAEAADNGQLAPGLAAGIVRVRSAKCVGVRTGNWLSARQAQTLLNAPDVTTLRGHVRAHPTAGWPLDASSIGSASTDMSAQRRCRTGSKRRSTRGRRGQQAATDTFSGPCSEASAFRLSALARRSSGKCCASTRQKSESPDSRLTIVGRAPSCAAQRAAS